jgi:hypothetical protein
MGAKLCRVGLPRVTLILDFIHANEYLWGVANSLFGEGKDHELQRLVG